MTPAEKEAFWKAYPRVIAKRSCTIDGCEGEAKGHGLCSSHLNRLKRYGSPHGGSNAARQGEGIRWLQAAILEDTDDCQIWPFKPDGRGNGYGIFALNGVLYRAHRFVCELTNGLPPTEKHEAAHECGVSLCCNKRHISWKTHKENIADKVVHGTNLIGERHHQCKLSKAQVIEIRGLRNRVSRRAIAERFGVGRSTIDNIIDRTTWRHI